MTQTKRILTESEQCIIRLKDSLFRRDSKVKSHVFPKPIEYFEIYKPNTTGKPSYWSIVGSWKSQFLNIISGKYIPYPPLSRTYPFISKNFKYDKIQFLNFKENSGLDKVHLSARYETFSYKGKLEMSDDVNSVRNYITGANNYNSDLSGLNPEYAEKLMELFKLSHLSNKWINSLSNGQLRRARLAKSLISQPSLLVIDDPFLGLDPDATKLVSSSLKKVSKDLKISIVLGLRAQDDIPEWIENVGYVNDEGLVLSGKKKEVLPLIQDELRLVTSLHKKHEDHLKHQNPDEISNKSLIGSKPAHIEFLNASVVYKDLPVLKDFNWRIPRGSKWRILGNNGTGKTTILSLITADHPQSWKSVLSIDGKLRKTGNGSSFFDINNKIGISSPELHALVPNNKTMKEVILTGLVNDVGNSNFMFVAKEDALCDFGRQILNRFDDRLTLYGSTNFFELSLTDQKLSLFLRAIIKQPELLILDEAFSCMEDEEVMIRCHNIIENEIQNTTVLTIGHIDWEVPRCDYLLKLYGGENRTYKLFKY